MLGIEFHGFMQFMTTLLPRPMHVIVFQGFLPENLAACLLYVFHILLLNSWENCALSSMVIIYYLLLLYM